jgi:hypothetical protein
VDEHRTAVVRYAFVVHPQTGQFVTMVWRIDLDDAGEHVAACDPVVRTEPNLILTCRVHVDGGEVLMGIPTAKAFGVLELPPGRKMTLPETISPMAGRERLSPESFALLEDSLHQMAGFAPQHQ